ncbi:KilA-N domain-containing protein [Flavobacterium sp. TMP13]|uniref:KilA-N domain-containing protein n=1 Tax=Flavobacterium sp. TMP13 TaxID=3425950 RepID=UPI003D7841EC
MKDKTINIEGTSIGIITNNNVDDFICLTDMAHANEGESRAADIIKNWLRNRYTIEFLGTWKEINNPNFKVVESDHFKIKQVYQALC